MLGDVELPYQHAEFINNCIELALAWRIKALVLAGDFLHWGALAHFFESDKATDEEIEQVEQSIAGFVKPFERVVWVSGNHDRRPQIAIDRFVAADRFARLVVLPELAEEFKRKVIVSDYFYCYVGNEWQVEHPKATNIVPANAARGLAEIHNRSVAMAHNHLVGIQQTADGRHWGVEIGCCVDPERLGYYQFRHMKRPKMKNGALILRKVGERFFPTLLCPEWTDFEWEKRQGAAQSQRYAKPARRSAKLR